MAVHGCGTPSAACKPSTVSNIFSVHAIHSPEEEEEEEEEEDAFWDWAVVETSHHSGVRIEELCELTHLSVRQYRRARRRRGAEKNLLHNVGSWPCRADGDKDCARIG
jgi:hypothetical protein